MNNLENFNVEEFLRKAEPCNLLLDTQRELESKTPLIDYSQLRQAQDEAYLKYRIVGA